MAEKIRDKKNDKKGQHTGNTPANSKDQGKRPEASKKGHDSKKR